MKRTLLAALVIGVAYLFLPTKAEGQVFSIFSGVQTNADTTTAPYPTGSTNGLYSCGTRCDWRVWCEASCAAIITAYCRIDSSDSEPWYACATVTNPAIVTGPPGTSGNYVSLPNSRQYKFAIESWSSGKVHVKYFSSSQP